MTLLSFLLGCVAFLLLLGPAGLALPRRLASDAIYPLTALVCAALGVGALAGLLAGRVESLVLPLGVPWIGAHLRLDALAAFFLAVVGFGGFAASLYAIGYARHEEEPRRVLPFYAPFIAAMALVVLAADAFTFLLAWETMSVTSWALVMAHHERPGNLLAGHVYLVVASMGTLVLLLAFGLLAGSHGHYDFASIRQVAAHRPMAWLVLLLVLVGTGSKAGLVPLHAWLPLAHPAAPSHVSGLMSGIMTKVAIYGFIRIAFDLLGAPVWWWSLPPLVVGALTAVIGLLYAVAEDDLKRLLAYSTVENVGIVFLGLGLAMAFRAGRLETAAALALTASLLHAANHATFKSLLFFGAGSVLDATGERDLGRLGGLIHRMPATAVLFLIGTAAISALPPLNGFVSEWLLFQTVLTSPLLAPWLLKFLVPAAGAMLALAAALAAACFVRAYGMTFLGRPRSAQAASANEVDGWQRAAMALLAAACVLLGVLPGLAVDALRPLLRLLLGTNLPRQATEAWLSLIPLSARAGSYNGLIVLVFMVLAGTSAALLVRAVAARRMRRAPAWDCGFPATSPTTQYTPGSFAQPLSRVFGAMAFDTAEIVTMPPPGGLGPARFSRRSRDRIWELLYRRLALLVERIATRLNRLQFLTIRKYLSLVFAALVLLLVLLALWQ